MKKLVWGIFCLSAVAFGKLPTGWFSLPHEYQRGGGSGRHAYRLFEHADGSLTYHFSFTRTSDLYAPRFEVLLGADHRPVLFLVDATAGTLVRIDAKGERSLAVAGRAIQVAPLSESAVMVLLDSGGIVRCSADGTVKPLLPLDWRKGMSKAMDFARVGPERLAMLAEHELLLIDVQDPLKPVVIGRVDLAAAAVAHPFLEEPRAMVANAQGAWLDCGVSPYSGLQQFRHVLAFVDYKGGISLPTTIQPNPAGYRLFRVDASSRLIFREGTDYQTMLPGGQPERVGPGVFREEDLRARDPQYRFSWHGTPVWHPVVDPPWVRDAASAGALLRARTDQYLVRFGAEWDRVQLAARVRPPRPFAETVSPDDARVFNQSGAVLTDLARLTTDQLFDQGLRMQVGYLERAAASPAKMTNWRAIASALAALDLQAAGDCLTSFNGGADIPVLAH